MTLAIHGGKPVRKKPLPERPAYEKEIDAAIDVVRGGNLSGFLADPGEAWLGGPRVQALEAAWCEKFGVKYAVSMNSATSCLFGAVQAVTSPGDGVIVTPWSMSASVTCALEAQCDPWFCDIEDRTYGLGKPATARYGSRTAGNLARVIVLVHLFGCPAVETIAWRTYAANHGMTLIEDASQAPGALWADGTLVGTLGDVGVFSLNCHKQIQAGEGGIAITDNAEIADFLRCYRNHGEIRGFRRKGYWGGNYRLSEIHAAIGEVQLARLEELVAPRVRNAGRLTEVLSELDGIVPPYVPDALRSVYYLYAVRVPGDAVWWADALSAEGIPAAPYVRALYHEVEVLRGYAKRDDTNDWKGWYPNVEACSRDTVVIPHVHARMTDDDIDDVAKAFQKVWRHWKGLR